MFQRGGIFGRTARNAQGFAGEQNLTRPIIIVFIDAYKRLQRTVEFSGIYGRGRRPDELADFVVEREEFFLVGLRVNSRLLLQAKGAHGT
jgi:hypothetical protein